VKNFLGKVVTAPTFYSFLLSIKPFIGKNLLFLICAAALILYNVFTCTLISRLKDETIIVTGAYAELIGTAVSGIMEHEKINDALQTVLHKSKNPVIITDTAWNPVIWENIYTGPLFKRKLLEQTTLTPETEQFLRKKIMEFKNTYEPHPIIIKDSNTQLGFLFFGNQPLIRSLTLMPFFEIGLVALLIGLAYLSFNSIRNTERSRLWVGLAKETAHQLGTPISSLMGWVEYIKTIQETSSPLDPQIFMEQAKTICDDMENDLKRLIKVTSRFSQIGSVPLLSPLSVNTVVHDIAAYFRMRMPFSRKKIEIRCNTSKTPDVNVNHELVEWVFENLVKNSVDAIESNNGLIEIKTEYVSEKRILRILFIDNGNGISWEAQKRIFVPGYTTKKRGWGLGLTLAKRIIEDYHKGRIYVKSSQKDKGTVFCIDLPVNTENV